MTTIRKISNNYSTVAVTRGELVDFCRNMNQTFREFLEDRGIIHEPNIHVESWTGESDDHGKPEVFYYRNYLQKTDTENARDEGGIGRIDRK